MSIMISEWTLAYLQLLVYFLQCICFLFCTGNKSYHLITIRKGKQWWYLPFKNKDITISIFLPFKKLPLHLRKTAKLWTGQQEFYPVLVILWLYWSFFLCLDTIHLFISFWRLQTDTQAEKGQKHRNGGNRTRMLMVSQSRYQERKLLMTGEIKQTTFYFFQLIN